MQTANSVLMKMARESLKGKWGKAIGVSLLFMVISFVVGIIPVLGSIAGWIITGPLILGLVMFFLSLSRGQEADTGQIFHGFDHFGKSLGAYLLMMLFIFLWMLLLIIPGIIAAFSYSMTFYILADDPSLRVIDVLKKSKAMMYGYKLKLFGLHLRFLGWGLLCILTLGIGFIWLFPYIQMATVKFYEDIKDKPIARPVSPSGV
jgi:uncharacterized membrane protein